MLRSAQQLRDDAYRIWQAGVDAVRPERLMPQFVRVDRNRLSLGDEEFDLTSIRRIVVVGAGKAGTAMVLALENALGFPVLREKRVSGCVNVPANCLAATAAIALHAARPAGVNEPTTEGVAGTRCILELVGSLDSSDLCIALISGGGSALLPAPIDDVSLHEKIVLTRLMVASGATIEQLNAVRRELSQVKGGGLARACRAGRLVSMILSDVPGDDLETIASGPTVASEPNPRRAIETLQELGLHTHPAMQSVVHVLQKAVLQKASTPSPSQPFPRETTSAKVSNLVIGNNATAVDAAGVEAERLGYSHAMVSAARPEGPVKEVAQHLVQMAQSMRDCSAKRTLEPDCLISGGEPTLQLVTELERGLGGRNQQLALAALAQLGDWRGLALLSGGTDGEDGPTDAAGAWVGEQLAQDAARRQLDAGDYLRRNDAYRFFKPLGGLLKTGPTHTNVGDLRVVTVSRK